MKAVAELQRFISTLVEPMRAAGASDKACGELGQVAQMLDPFKERTLAEMAEMLRMIDEHRRSGTWPQPAAKASRSRKPAAPKAPKLTVPDAAQRVMALLERVDDPDLDYAAIDAELQPMEAMTKADLLKVAAEVGMTIASRSTKPAILEELRRRIRDRKGTVERTQFRGEMPPADAPVGANVENG